MPTNDASEPTEPLTATLRCAFCLSRNRVDVSRAADRPKCGSCGRPMLLDRPVKVEDADFETAVLGAAVPVLVDFYADWCGPCRMVAPVLDELAQESVGRLLIAKVDTDRAPATAERFGIRSIPTLILFRGGEEAQRIVGVDLDALRRVVRDAAA